MGKQRFIAFLSGSQEVPPVRTNASGRFVAVLNKDKTKLHYQLEVNNLRNFTQAHIHVGRKGVNGPVVAFLFGLTMPGISVNRGVVVGTITKKDLVGPLAGRSLRSLVRLLKNKQTYVNAHTEQNPDGEIRGQIRKF